MAQAPLTGASSESILVSLAKVESKQPAAVNTLFRVSSSVYQAVVDRSRGFDFPALTTLLLDLEQKRAGNAVWAMIDLFPALPFCHGEPAGPAISLCAGWFLTILAAKQLDDAQDEGTAAKIPLGLSLLGIAQQFLAGLETDQNTQAAILDAFGRQISLAAATQSRHTLPSQANYERYFHDVVAKSGNTFAVGAWCGARLLLNGSANVDLTPYYRFGMAMGVAIQLRDDLADWRDDLRQNKLTLPVIYALKNSQVQLTDESFDETTMAKMEAAVGECDAETWCQGQIGRYKQDVFTALAQLPGDLTWLDQLVTAL